MYEQDWNAGDDIGRIKIVISEGFPRDSPTMPLERIKNVVAFSFQHAPLGTNTIPSSCIFLITVSSRGEITLRKSIRR